MYENNRCNMFHLLVNIQLMVETASVELFDMQHHPGREQLNHRTVALTVVYPAWSIKVQLLLETVTEGALVKTENTLRTISISL